jgi:hypothetical protein
LQALKVNLKLWNEQVFGNVDSLKKARLEDLRAFDRLEEERGLDSEEKLRQSLIVSDSEKIVLQEEISWRQKSRALCLKKVTNAQSSFIGLQTRTGDPNP